MEVPNQSIPKGYALTFTTWENDADNYAEKVLYCRSKADVKFYLNLLNRFRSHHEGGLGNEDYETDQEVAAIEAAFNQSPPDSQELLDNIKVTLSEWRDDPQFMEGFFETWGLDYGINKWRVFDSYKVHFIPKECPDCTAEFSVQ